jgi:hypothetical protein
MIKLHYYPASGWTKEFATEEEVRQELYRNTCGICRVGEKVYGNDGELVHEFEGVNPDSSLGDLLSTGCGCEFGVEYE